MPAKKKETAARRVVVVGGVRTPFVKAFGQLIKIDTIGLGVAAVGALLERTGIARKEIEGIVWGGVILPGTAPNVGREIALDLRLPPSVSKPTTRQPALTRLRENEPPMMPSPITPTVLVDFLGLISTPS